MIETGGRHLRIGRLRDRVGKDRQMIFMPYIVGIKKCDPIPASLPTTQIAGGIAAGARRFPLEQADTRAADGGGNVPTAIAGTIVDDDQLGGGKALGQNAVARSGYMRRLVVERDRKSKRLN